MNSIALPDGRLHIPVSEIPDLAAMIRAQGWMTTEDDAQAQALLNARYVLVYNDGDEKLRCERCNRKHMYFTRFCIERPWRGLQHALYGYWVNVGATNPGDLTPVQRARLKALDPFFGGSRSPIPLSTSHPRTAHALGTPETSADMGATVLGSLDVITPLKAAMLADQINTAARRVVIRI
jgi:hypothetical protein